MGLSLPLPLLLALLLATADLVSGEDCLVDVKNKTNMPKKQPLLLKEGGSKDVHGFVTPNSAGEIKLKPNDKIIVACPDSKLITGEPQATASCVKGTTFLINGKPYDFPNLDCQSHLRPSDLNTCGSRGQYKVVPLGFKVGSAFYTLIDACFDERSYSTVYTHFTMVAEIRGRQEGFERPKNWFPGNFYPGIDMDKQYTRQTERQTFKRLLGNKLGAKYISLTNNYFLSKGHLAAKSDFMLGLEEYPTFFYMNAAPQWQTLNGGNWNTMESDVRSYAERNEVELEIYTGTHGITTRRNDKNAETELYLYADGAGNKYVPVPKIFWKIVYNAKTLAAVVFVSVNNPYIKKPGDDYIICRDAKDVCSKIEWISWNATSQEDGISYCCEYAVFKEAVADAPNLSVTSLLT